MKIYKRALTSFKDFLWAKRFYFVLCFWVFVSAISVAEIFLATQVIGYIESFIGTWVNNVNEIIFFSVIWWVTVLLAIVFQYIYRFNLVDKDILKFYVNNLNVTANKALHIPFWTYLHKKSWTVFKRLEKWREWFMSLFFFFYLNIVKDISGIIIITWIMFFVDWRMSLIILSWLPIAIFIGYFFNTKTLFLQNENNKKEDVVFWIISDSLSNFWLLKILTLEWSISRQFEQTENKLLKIQNNISKRWAIANVYISSVVAIMRIMSVIFWCYFIYNWSLTLAELFLFFTLIGWIYFPIWWIFGQIRQLQRWWSNLEEFYEEFEDTLEQEDLNTWKSLSAPEWNIEFKNINFWYSSEKQILKNISLTAKKWQKIALVGNTGAGKSTIVNLLLRFWDVDSWEILLDGININTLKKSSLRNHIWVVSQDNSLFNLSIEENLKFANPEVSEADLKDALQKAEADFVFTLKDWIKTVIGERGLKLSGWEKQRISIARLFLKNPEILLLDEATSALDNKTENLIQSSLDRLMQWKTSIIIAHRLSTIRHADIIYMLEDGEVVESGSYETLMSKKAKFFELANPDKLILW